MSYAKPHVQPASIFLVFQKPAPIAELKAGLVTESDIVPHGPATPTGPGHHCFMTLFGLASRYVHESLKVGPQVNGVDAT